MSDSESTTPAAESAPEANEPQTFSLDYVKTLRDEAAKHRTAKQAIVEELTAKHDVALTEVKTAAEAKIAEAHGESASKDVNIAKLRAAFELKVPADKLDSFLDSVQGTTPEEVQESAKKLSDLVGGFQTQTGTPAFDPTQGQGTQHPPLNGNPLLKSIEQKLGI
jgi:hypothetical protein